ncbi:Putative NADP-dependent oxidoreductase [Marinovum algicola DG 898]|nr:Putative NADP-dependent oxidoreductase [Marinovum algicola DG 898]
MPAPGADEVLVKVSHLSLDPYMRGRMSDAKSYADPVAVDAVMTGQGVGHVVESRAEGFAEGDLVTGMTGWQSHAVLPGKELRKLDADLAPSTALGVLGMPGFTGWTGMTKFGRPQQGETLVVAAATGPVGSMVGQLAKRAGMRTVAIAGGAEKCRIAQETFGFDTAIDHHAFDEVADLRAAIAAAAPDGVDVYFENVGGDVLRAVLPLLNTHARVPVIGTVAWYEGVSTDGPDTLPALWRQVLVKRLSIQGLIIFDHWDDFPAFLDEVAPLVKSGGVTWLEDVAQGLENAPQAFLDMLRGGNLGKQIVAL